MEYVLGDIIISSCVPTLMSLWKSPHLDLAVIVMCFLLNTV